MINLISQSGQAVYGLKEFIVDNYNELSEIDMAAVVPGSKAYVIDEQKFYILNGLNTWVPDLSCGGAAMKIEVLEELPASGESGVMYLVPAEGTTVEDNLYEEWLWVNDAWERLSASIDISGVTHSFEGQDPPVGSIVAKKGDIYRDTNTNKLYMCTQYVDPAQITDLTGLDVILRSKVTPLPDASKQYHITADTNWSKISGRYPMTYLDTFLRRIRCGYAYGYDYISTTPDSEGLCNIGFAFEMKGISGSDASNPEFVDWVKENASSIIGVGSQWVETPNISALEEEIDDLRLFKFPNATIVGSPKIDNGQISNFSDSNYLQFPFIVDVKNRPFEIDFCFTTGTDVTTQQNILDSEFGLALAVKSGKGVMSMSSNGTSWDIGSVTGTKAIATNTTYYAKLTWNGSTYKTALSTDGITYNDDMMINSTLPLFPRTIFIGGSYGLFGSGTAHPFKGSINLNKATLTINDLVVWSGMDDAGLSTRADVSLSNIDDAGKQVIKDTGIKTLTGSGIPSSVLVTKAGDFYRDIDTNKLYQCIAYNTRDSLSDLTGLTIKWKSQVEQLPNRYYKEWKINFRSNNINFSGIRHDSANAPMSFSYTGSTGVTLDSTRYMEPFDIPEGYREFVVSGGNDVKESSLIEYIKTNAETISGLGSQWVEVSPNIDLDVVDLTSDTNYIQILAPDMKTNIGTSAQMSATYSSTFVNWDDFVKYQKTSFILKFTVLYYTGGYKSNIHVVMNGGITPQANKVMQYWGVVNIGGYYYQVLFMINLNNPTTSQQVSIALTRNIEDITKILHKPALTEPKVGKVLQISKVEENDDYQCTWADISSVATFTGSGVPSSALIAKAGDFYRDIDSNKLYQCTAYNTRDSLSDVAGLTIKLYENLPIKYPYSDLAFSNIKSTINNIEYSSFRAYWVLSSTVWVEAVTSEGTYTRIGYVSTSYASSQPIYTYPEKREIHFISGTDSTNPKLIDWVKTNAETISGLGSQWVEVGVPTSVIESLIDEKLGVIENGTY